MSEPTGGNVSSVTQRQTRKWWIILLVVVLAVAVALVVTNMLRPGASDPGASPSASPTKTSQSPSPDPIPSESPTEGAPDVRVTLAPVELDGEQEPLTGVNVRLVSIESVEGEAVLPGEVSGPALRVTVEASNSTGERVETPAVVVNLYYGPSRVAGNPFIQPGGEPFPPSIPAGGTARGVYIFDVPESERGDLVIEVDLLFESSVVLFEGAFTG